MTHGTDPHSQSADAVAEGRPVEAQYARQGRRGSRVFLILALSLAGAVIAVFAAWAFFADDFQSTEPHNARQATDSASFQTQPGGALQTAAEDPTAAERGSTPDNQQLPQGGPDQAGVVQQRQMEAAQAQGAGAEGQPTNPQR